MKTFKFIRKVGLSLCLVLFISVFFVGCKKNNEDTPTPKEPTLTATLSEGKLYPGDTGKITVTIENLENKEYKFVMDESASSILSISNDGTITALSDGIVYIDCVSKEKETLRQTIKVQVWHHLLNEENYAVENIVTSLGEDSSTMMDINYHAFNTKTYVEYTTADDVNFEKALTAKEEGYFFEYTGPYVNNFTTARNVYHVVLKNLIPDTEYIYRINQGNDTYTQTFSFKTAKGNSNETTFLFLTDIHYATAKYNYLNGELIGGEISERVISKTRELYPEISFILQAGDMIDQGGDSAMWQEYFHYADSRYTIPWVGVPGNHEYYYGETTHIDNIFFVAYSGLTRNGPSTHLGSSCWYKYNDILFLLIDNNLDTAEQIEWVEEVLDTVDHKWAIATMHNPIERDNSDRDNALLKVFDKYAVDLVFQGHYHSKHITRDYYEGQTIKGEYKNTLGVNYFTGFVSGVKSINNERADKDTVGYVVEVKEDKIIITTLNSLGEVKAVDEFPYKKNEEIVPKTNEEIKNGISHELNQETKTLTFKFDGFYGNVRKVTFIDKLRGELNDSMVFPTTAYNSKTFINLLDGHVYDFDLIIEYMDGTKETLNYKFEVGSPFDATVFNVTKNSADVLINADSMLFLHIKEYHIYLNGKLVKTLPFMDSNGQTTLFKLEGLSKKTDYVLEIKARGYSDGYVSVEKIEFKTTR